MQGGLAIAAALALGAVPVGLGVLALGFVGRDLAAGGGRGSAPTRLPNPDLQLLSDPDYDQRLARDSIRPVYEPSSSRRPKHRSLTTRS